jgi:hypothetical protein
MCLLLEALRLFDAIGAHLPAATGSGRGKGSE